MSDVMVCEGRAFRRRLGRKDRALMNGTRVLFFCFFKHFLMWTIFFLICYNIVPVLFWFLAARHVGSYFPTRDGTHTP